jgi:hypothetical protein
MPYEAAASGRTRRAVAFRPVRANDDAAPCSRPKPRPAYNAPSTNGARRPSRPRRPSDTRTLLRARATSEVVGSELARAVSPRGRVASPLFDRRACARERDPIVSWADLSRNSTPSSAVSSAPDLHRHLPRPQARPAQVTGPASRAPRPPRSSYIQVDQQPIGAAGPGRGQRGRGLVRRLLRPREPLLLGAAS